MHREQCALKPETALHRGLTNSVIIQEEEGNAPPKSGTFLLRTHSMSSQFSINWMKQGFSFLLTEDTNPP